MLFAEYQRYQYARSPLIEVICQFRFPTILSIGASEPVQFQEAIRDRFPRYAVRQEPRPPMVLPGPSPTVEGRKTVANYSFITADGSWKVNLTQDFIALSTLRYQRWEEFAARLDKLLAEFIQIYRPAFFTRMGLRYVNAFSRRALGLEDLLWDDLLRDAYLGVLVEPDVDEGAVAKCALDVEAALAEGCRMKLHAGPGRLQAREAQPETRFILDGDFSVSGSLPGDVAPRKLEELHRYAVRLFQGAITPELHQAMGPLPLE